MILVDIYVPSVNNIYDFQLDEKTAVETIIEEISELIEQKEHCKIAGNVEELLLCHKKTKQILPGNRTLEDCGIQTGNSLILV